MHQGTFFAECYHYMAVSARNLHITSTLLQNLGLQSSLTTKNVFQKKHPVQDNTSKSNDPACWQLTFFFQKKSLAYLINIGNAQIPVSLSASALYPQLQLNVHYLLGNSHQTQSICNPQRQHYVYLAVLGSST